MSCPPPSAHPSPSTEGIHKPGMPKNTEVIRRRLFAMRKGILKKLVPFAYGAFPHKANWSFTGEITAQPKRILLLNGAHIGDIIIATSLIPILRTAFPSAEIGFAVGSWAQIVVENHPDIKYLHRIDHWRANRSSDPLLRKMRQYRTTRRRALQEIRTIRYDVALCLFSHFPDFLDICWDARIPVRVAFRPSFFSALATHLVDEPSNPLIHQGARLSQLLRVLPIDSVHFQLRRSTLPPTNSSAVHEVCHLLQVPSLENVRYRIIHIGSGDMRREFPDSFWRELAEKLSSNHTLLFTGQGRREASKIAQIIRGLPNCINACDRLSWNGYVASVRHAEVLYGVESMAGHLAGAVGTKCVVVYGGAAGVARWRPEGAESIVFTNHVPCAPCHQPSGCPEMTCMQGFGADNLIFLTEDTRQS